MERLSGAQKLVKLFSSKAKFKAMEEESRKWKFTCPNCSEESSIWEAGGIRYKAKGEPTKTVKCPKCSKVAAMKLKIC